jgi:hypothetical protein
MMRSSFVLLCSLFLTGCALGPSAAPSPDQGRSLQGNVHGGRQPIAGAHVYLFAANITGYGQPSVSLLNPSATGAATDPVGTYVTTDANGLFTITNDYSCTAGQQVYLYALGGDPGAGTNSAAGLIAVLGSCPSSGSFLSSIPFIQINEVTTVAGAYAMAGFATDATHVSSSGTPAAQTGIANAFATAGNLANLSTGMAYATTPAGNGTVPQDIINTIADILASCVNSSGPGSLSCGTLFSNAKNSAVVTPSDTATAVINIAHHPVANVATLFGLITPAAPFLPNRPTPPNDFTLGLYFSVGIQSNPNTALAIDSQGNVWSTSNSSVSVPPFSIGQVIKLSPLGASLAGSTGFIGGGLTISVSLTIDPQDNVWVINYPTDSLVKLDNSGNFLSGASGYTGGGIHFPRSLVSDGSGNIFVINYGGSGHETASSFSKFTNSGTAVSPTTGYTAGGLLGPEGIAVDPFTNVWATSYYQSVLPPVPSSNSATPVPRSPDPPDSQETDSPYPSQSPSIRPATHGSQINWVSS